MGFTDLRYVYIVLWSQHCLHNLFYPPHHPPFHINCMLLYSFLCPLSGMFTFMPTNCWAFNMCVIMSYDSFSTEAREMAQWAVACSSRVRTKVQIPRIQVKAGQVQWLSAILVESRAHWGKLKITTLSIDKWGRLSTSVSCLHTHTCAHTSRLTSHPTG